MSGTACNWIEAAGTEVQEILSLMLGAGRWFTSLVLILVAVVLIVRWWPRGPKRT